MLLRGLNVPDYSGIQKEETLKGLVYQDYFSKFSYEPNIDNIDFVVTNKKARGDLFSESMGSSVHIAYGEAKKGIRDLFDMFTQLILTCKKTYEKGEHLAPPWLLVFDEARIAFVAFHDILPIFTETDFNWNQTPSNHETADFQKAREKVKNLIGAKIVVYNFGADDNEIKEFIKTHFVAGASASIKSPITKDNFVQIFIKWVKEVKPYIIDRRDLLVPQNIREVKGSFFTPKIWADKSKEYLADVFGADWQDEYYIWDCAAGTGNLLAGLANKYNVWASTIDETDVDTINTLIDIDDSLDLLPSHIFQFDFLNDSFDKLPEELRKIINDPEKRRKLIIYINPPYAEVSSVGIKGKAGVNQSKMHDKYAKSLGTAGRELFAQFLVRIYFEIQGCKIGEFSTLKVLNGPAFEKFRSVFLAKLKKCFIMPAYTFDNVNGKFPTGFKIWDTSEKEKFEEIKTDVFDENNQYIGCKTFCNFKKSQIINNWISTFTDKKNNFIGFLAGTNGNDFQQNQIVYILNKREQMANPRGIEITAKNIIECSMYFAVRHCFEHTWINHNDQFLYPNENYKTDVEFQNDCLIFTLLHAKNAVQSQYGTNHWIPFSEKEAGAKEKFESNFMSNYLEDKTFSVEAQAVLSAGLELWKYYHAKIKSNNTASVNASFYDIREFFQGRKESGTMNTKSADETYNALITGVRDAQKALVEKIAPKVYEYGFLKE
ncbi:MAG: hypothetical protein Pg6A_14180 [Termitinemataceae bacterium]|nr:MAG: hypothetical protein Pg6A_14180 [Termitinemataceae bacterium]